MTSVRVHCLAPDLLAVDCDALRLNTAFGKDGKGKEVKACTVFTWDLFPDKRHSFRKRPKTLLVLQNVSPLLRN